MGLEEVKIKYSSNVEAADKSKIKEILNAICGILNNPKDGGKLILFSEIPYTKKNLDDITRKIEQKLQETFGLPATREIIDKIPQDKVGNDFEIHYRIKPTSLFPSKLYTVNYNMCCTTTTQVHHVSSSEPLKDILEIIKGEQKREKKIVLGKHLKVFSYGETVSLEEGKEVQLKYLKDKVSTKSGLAERMTSSSNKLSQYVSAFANGSGGHIYYGIQLNGSGQYIAYGQNVDEKETIINEVKRAINKLFVWPDNKQGLKKGEQWDIYFEKISNTEEAKYVIVISVNSHDRGVSIREPESYVVGSDGNVQPMKFSDWTERCLLTNYWYVFSNKKLPQVVGRCEWSSPEAFENHCRVLRKLVILRNNAHRDDFNAYKAEELLQSSDTNTECLIQQQEAANFFRNMCLEEAEAKLDENEKFLNETTNFADVGIYHTRRLYWKGVVKRAQGDYAKCDELCELALQNSQQLPTILVIPWVYYNRAKRLEIDIAKEEDIVVERGLRDECMRHFESALRCSFALEDFPESLVVDLKQRVLIGMARLSFGAFYHEGKIVRKTCLPSDVEHAKHCLKVVDASVEELGVSMTKLNKAEYKLAHAEQYYNRWMELSKQNFIGEALKKSKKALKSATAGKFKAVRDFAEAQIKSLEKLGGEKEA